MPQSITGMARARNYRHAGRPSLARPSRYGAEGDGRIWPVFSFWNDGAMNSPELMRAAEARGVTTSYYSSPGHEVTVSAETIGAILAALGDPPAAPLPATGPDLAGLAAPVPEGRSWGLAIQLYAVRSRASWGHGDFRDLADLASWSARELGAGFILINPLHAAEPVPPVSTSPYLPMSRRFISPLYLRIEDIPEYSTLDDRERGHVAALARPLRAASEAGSLLDRDAVLGCEAGRTEDPSPGTDEPAASRRVRRVP